MGIVTLEVPYTVRPCTKTELLKLYRPITLYVLNKWLEAIEDEIGPIVGRTLSIAQMKKFIERYDLPTQIVAETTKT